MKKPFILLFQLSILALFLSCTSDPQPTFDITSPTIPVRSAYSNYDGMSFQLSRNYSSRQKALLHKPKLLKCYPEDSLSNLITIDIDSASFYALTLVSHDTIKLWYNCTDSMPTLNFVTRQPLSYTQSYIRDSGLYSYAIPFHKADGYCFLSRLDFPYPLTEKTDTADIPLYANMKISIYPYEEYSFTESHIEYYSRTGEYYWFVEPDEKTKFLHWLTSPPPSSLNH